MTPSELYTELTTGPLAADIASHIASGSDIEIHNLLHDKTKFTQYGWITVAKFNAWCAKNNAEYQNIKAIAADGTSPFNSAAESLLRCLSGAVSDGAVNLSDADIVGLVNVWPFVDATGAAKASLLALGTFPASRADIIKTYPSINDIAAALGRP